MSSAVPISVRHHSNDAFSMDTHAHHGGDFSQQRQSYKNTPTSLSHWLNMSGSGGSSFDWNMLNNISKLGTSAESDRARSFKAFLSQDNNPLARDDFCRDFTCCGLVLSDLHSLLQHYEDVHVVVMESPEVGPQQTSSNAKGMAASAFDPSEMELDAGPSNGVSQQGHVMPSNLQSAFDTSVLRTGPRASFPSIQTGSRTTSPTRSGASTPMSQRFPYGLDSPDSPAQSITPSMLSAPSTPLSSRPGSPTGNYSDSTTTGSRPGSSLSRTKPFKCPTPGCNKQYLQANGLKYHRLHGQCNFASKDPSLEGLSEQEAEEKLRPYACAVGGNCERRYKNMNGLRYHYQHSGAHGAIGLALLASGHHHPLPGKSGLSHQKKKDGQGPQDLAQQAQENHWQQLQQQQGQLTPQQEQQLMWEQNPYAGYAVPMGDLNMDA